MIDNLILYTLGLYGTSEQEFFGILKDQKIDLFIDVRARRGVRGKLYPFANAKRLIQRLGSESIEYLHQPLFAPSKDLRELQNKVDAASRIKKSERQTLSERFVAEYYAAIQNVDLSEIQRLAERFERLCFFCVERSPDACHRSLLTEILHKRYGWRVIHL